MDVVKMDIFLKSDSWGGVGGINLLIPKSCKNGMRLARIVYKPTAYVQDLLPTG